jgi:hypothetical protein
MGDLAIWRVAKALYMAWKAKMRAVVVQKSIFIICDLKIGI